MVRIAIPPTTLASSLISTLAIHIAARFGKDLEIKREAGEFLAIDIPTEPDELGRAIIVSLMSRELRPEDVRGALPLVPGTGPGTDGKVLSGILSEVGISRPSLRADRRLEIYDNLVKYLDRYRIQLIATLSKLSISISRGVLEIVLGSAEEPVPVIIKSEAFYELGRFGGVSDRKRGRPDIGRVDYRASKPVAALLYALLLALQSGFEAGVTEAYMFTTIGLDPGKITSSQAKLLNKLYLDLLNEVRKVGLRTWAQDYEGLRLATILKLVELYRTLRREIMVEPPPNAMFYHIVVGATGRRFFPLWSIAVSPSELDTVGKVIESFVKEMQIDIDKVLRLLRVLTVSTLRMISRSTSSSVVELWQGVKMLIYSFIEGRMYELLDNAYRMMRLLSDAKTGLRSELIGTISSSVQELGLDLDSIIIEPMQDRRAALWRSLIKLVKAVT